jgi:hypothetical protein
MTHQQSSHCATWLDDGIPGAASAQTGSMDYYWWRSKDHDIKINKQHFTQPAKTFRLPRRESISASS